MIIVMGIPGAGKTTVLNDAVKASKFKVVNWGDRMVEIANKQNLAAGRDQIRKLPVEKQRKLQKDVAQSLAQEKGIVLDTHASINTPEGYFPGLPFDVLGLLKVERLVLVEAPVDDIMRRRKSDASRTRDAQDRAKLEEQIFVNKAMACAYAAFSGAPVIFIMNRDGGLQEAVEQLRKVLI